MSRRSKRIESRSAPKDDDHESSSAVATTVATFAESSEPGSFVHAPAETDYILGRGLAHVAHQGNAYMHDMLERYLPKYTSATSKLAKMKIVRHIYDKLSAKGRFIDKRKNSATYFVVDAATAREKISHGIRYRRRLQASRVTSSSSPSSEKSSSESSDERGETSDKARESSDSSPSAEAPAAASVAPAAAAAQAQIPSFSIGSGSLNSPASWSSHQAFAGPPVEREKFEIEGMAGLVGNNEEGSIASGLFSAQTLQAIMETDPVLAAPRFSSSDSSPGDPSSELSK